MIFKSWYRSGNHQVLSDGNLGLDKGIWKLKMIKYLPINKPDVVTRLFYTEPFSKQFI